MLPRHLPQAARPDWGGTPVSRRLKLPKQAMSPVPLVRLVLLASPALSVPPGGSFASSDPKRIAAGRAQRRLVFRILLAAWLPPAVVLVRQPQPGIAARTVASWPDRWAASAERLVPIICRLSSGMHVCLMRKEKRQQIMYWLMCHALVLVFYQENRILSIS